MNPGISLPVYFPSLDLGKASAISVAPTFESALLEGLTAIRAKEKLLIEETKKNSNEEQRLQFQFDIQTRSTQLQQMLSEAVTWVSSGSTIQSFTCQYLADLDSMGQHFREKTAHNQSKQKSLVEALRAIGGQIQGSNIQESQESYRAVPSKHPVKCLQKQLKEDPFLALKRNDLQSNPNAILATVTQRCAQERAFGDALSQKDNEATTGGFGQIMKTVRAFVQDVRQRTQEKASEEASKRKPILNPVIIRAPKDMSKLDAFQALYENAEVRGLASLVTAAGKSPCSSWNAAQIYNRYCPKDRCGLVRGKIVESDFGPFPDMEVSKYDEEYGSGSAAMALQMHRLKGITFGPKQEYPLDGNRCRYFTPAFEKITPRDQMVDLNGMFRKCELEATLKTGSKEGSFEQALESQQILF